MIFPHETFIAKLKKSKVRLFEKFLSRFWIRYSSIRTFTFREKYGFVKEAIVKFNDFVSTKSRSKEKFVRSNLIRTLYENWHRYVTPVLFYCFLTFMLHVLTRLYPMEKREILRKFLPSSSLSFCPAIFYSRFFFPSSDPFTYLRTIQSSFNHCFSIIYPSSFPFIENLQSI